MFRSVRIQNFRQFKDLELKNLGRINLITGQNNTGKTSLLEALFLLDGPVDPSRTTILAQFRGIDRISSETTEHWSWLFHRNDKYQEIFVEGALDSGQRRTLRIKLSGGSLIPHAADQPGQNGGRAAPTVTSTEPLPQLIYDAVAENGEPLTTEYRWTSQGLYMYPDRRGLDEQGFFLPDYHRIGASDVVRVSQVEAAGLDASLIDALRVVEPRLKQLRVLDLGGGARIYADLGGRPYVPASMMGAGIARVLTIIAAIVQRESSIMFIDEVADGLHYSVMADVWKAIIAAAHQHDVQVFATTHSYECIEAAVKAAADSNDALSFIRLERTDTRVRAIVANDEEIKDAIGLGFEMR